MTNRTGRLSLTPIAALLIGASYAVVLPPVLAQPATNPTVQQLQERAASSARNDVLQLYREALKNDTAYAAAQTRLARHEPVIAR